MAVVPLNSVTLCTGNLVTSNENPSPSLNSMFFSESDSVEGSAVGSAARLKAGGCGEEESGPEEDDIEDAD